MEKETGLLPFKAFIKIVKSKQPHDMSFIDATIIYEKLIYAKDKKDVKKNTHGEISSVLPRK